MKDLFSPDSHWHDLGEVKYELLFPGRLLLQFLQRDDFPKALNKLECVTSLPFPEQWVEQIRLAASLKEPDRDGNGSGAVAEGSHHHLSNRVGQRSQEGKGEANVYFWIQRLILGVGASLLHAVPEGDTQIERGAGLEGVSSVLFWKATSAERQPRDVMDGFSFQIVNTFTRSHQHIGNCLLKIFHSILHHHIPSNSGLSVQNRLVKKLRLFLLQVPCFSWNDWTLKRWNF